MPFPAPGTECRRRWAYVVLAFAVVACVGVRLAWVPHRPVLAHDEAITYLHAAGKGAEYVGAVEPSATGRASGSPAGTWVSASEWTDFMRPVGQGLAEVSASVTKTDRHPPLYFWMLHVWEKTVGWDLNVGRMLQALIAALTVLAIYALGRATLKDPLVSALCALAFALLPGAIDTALFVRQYELLGLLTVVFAWQSVRIADPQHDPGWIETAALGVVALAGMLTHLYFALAITCGAVWIIARCARGNRERIWASAAAVALGVGGAWLIAPGALGVAGAGTEVANRVFASTSVRLATAARTLLNGVGVNQYTLAPLRALAAAVGAPSGWVIAAVMGLVALALVAAIVVVGTRDRACARETLVRGAALPFFLVWLTVGVLGLYFAVAKLGPAMGPRYLVMTWPFLVLTVGLLGMVWAKRPAALIALTCAWLLVLNVAGLTMDRPSDPASFATGAHHVVIDNLARGVVLPYGEALPASTQVFASWRTDLAENPAPWLSRLAVGDVVVLAEEYQPAGVPAARVLDLVRAKWTVEEVPLAGLRGRAYRLDTPTP